MLVGSEIMGPVIGGMNCAVYLIRVIQCLCYNRGESAKDNNVG